jgi:hypothetical protein
MSCHPERSLPRFFAANAVEGPAVSSRGFPADSSEMLLERLHKYRFERARLVGQGLTDCGKT